MPRRSKFSSRLPQPVSLARGRFITFEGGEGAGKSTQVRQLAERLMNCGHEVLATREPGGSSGAEMIRHVLLTGAAQPLGPLAETALFAAARADHVEETIRPALSRGAWVISDRFSDSTRAYQGASGAVTDDVIEALEILAVGNLRPDLTLILDVPADIGLARAAARSGIGADRFERESSAFHAALRERFISIARRDPARCAVIDACQTPEAVADKVWQIVTERLQPGYTPEQKQ